MSESEPQLFWPQIPDDLSAVAAETLRTWKIQLGLLILEIQGQQSRATARVRLEGRMPAHEYAQLCAWQEWARDRKLSMQQDVTRIRHELRSRAAPQSPGRRTYRDRLMDLLDNLAIDEALSEGVRCAADEFLRFLEKEEDDRQESES